MSRVINNEGDVPAVVPAGSDAAAAPGAAAGPGVPAAGPTVTFQVLSKQDLMEFNNFKLKMEELKNENRKTKVLAEKARHRSPQIKRSISVLMNLKYDLEDVKEGIGKIASGAESSDVVDKLGIVGEKIECSLQSLDYEILMNQMASKSKAGWKTVQMYEEETLFEEDDDAESKTKKFRAAERSALFLLNKRRENSGNRRGGFGGAGGSGQSGRGRGGNEGDSGAGHSGRQFNNFNKFSADRIANNVCFNCNLLGHHKKDCPKLKN